MLFYRTLSSIAPPHTSKLNRVAVFTPKQRLLLAVIPPLAVVLIRLLGMTLRYRDVNAPATPVGIKVPGPTIFAFWHCALLVCAYRFRNEGIAILISRSFDGELIARIVERLGFVAIRGSSTRGGPQALRGMQQAYTEAHRICAFTADGPKGPSRIAKPGPVQLAELTGANWVGAFHAQPDRTWQLHSWDRFMIPKPFTTVTFSWPAHTAPELESLQRALDEAVAMTSR